MLIASRQKLLQLSERPSLTMKQGCRKKNHQLKSLRHVAMVVKFLDVSKPKRHTESGLALFQTSSVILNFIQFFLSVDEIFWVNFIPKGPYLSPGKENFCVVLTYSIKGAREIRKLHVAVCNNG